MGKNATNKRNIVTEDPVVDSVLVCQTAPWDRESLARSTISACPKDGPARAIPPTSDDGDRPQCRMLFRLSVRPLWAAAA